MTTQSYSGFQIASDLDVVINGRKGFCGTGLDRGCDNGKMLHDTPVSIRKRRPEDWSITKSRDH